MTSMRFFACFRFRDAKRFQFLSADAGEPCRHTREDVAVRPHWAGQRTGRCQSSRTGGLIGYGNWQSYRKARSIEGDRVEHDRIELKDRNAALLWIVDNQKGRRNVSDIDRIALAVKKQEYWETSRKRLRLKVLKKVEDGRSWTSKDSLLAKLPKANPVDTRKIVAKSAGVGDRTYAAGKLILEATAKSEIKPEVVEDVRRGREGFDLALLRISRRRDRSQLENRSGWRWWQRSGVDSQRSECLLV